MNLSHIVNLSVHILSGTLGVLMGMLILATAKGTAKHRTRGRIFAQCVLIVCATATVGSIFFRFSPVFALLTVLVLYQMVSGWRSIRTKERGPEAIDAAWTGVAIAASALILSHLMRSPDQAGSNSAVVYATFAAIGIILAYDVVRWLFPRRWFARVWIYDHIYKLIASFGALLSAFAGNSLRFAQPWSQILPSVIGGSLIVWFFTHQARRRGDGPGPQGARVSPHPGVELAD